MQPYTAWQQAFDPLLTPGARNYWKSHNFTKLDDGLFDVVIEYVKRLPSPQCEIFFGAHRWRHHAAGARCHGVCPSRRQYVMNVHGRWDDAGR